MNLTVFNLDHHPTKPYAEFVDLQHDFKTYSNIPKLAERIRRVGFKYDFFAWETPDAVEYQGKTYPAGTSFIVDAHSRQRALRLLEEGGASIPPVPFTRVQAASLDEAKEEILFLNSKYGEIEDVSEFLTETLAAMDAEEQWLLSLFSDKESSEIKMDYNFDELDAQLQQLDGFNEIEITMLIPRQYESQVKEWLANGEVQTQPGLGKGVLKRCGLLL